MGSLYLDELRIIVEHRSRFQNTVLPEKGEGLGSECGCYWGRRQDEMIKSREPHIPEESGNHVNGTSVIIIHKFSEAEWIIFLKHQKGIIFVIQHFINEAS